MTQVLFTCIMALGGHPFSVISYTQYLPVLKIISA